MASHEKSDPNKQSLMQTTTIGGNYTVVNENDNHDFMVRCGSTFKLYWDILIILSALYNSIIIPVELAWNIESLAGWGEVAIESVINMVFMIDIFLNFRTTFISSVSGDEIFDPKHIAMKYIVEMRFILDVLSSIPFNTVSSTNILPLFGLLKLFRVTRIP